jgi:DtxR family Mn-dependent transcriptional regulator
MNLTGTLTATLEDYLEAIFNIAKNHKVARSMEIADSLNVKRSTVTVALRALAEKGYINYEPRSYVTLTESGEKAAKCVDKRHNILSDVFTEVFHLPHEASEKAACLMEHGMDTNICKAMTSLLKVVRNDKPFAQKLFAALDREGQTINCSATCDYQSERKENNIMKKQSSNLNMMGSGDTGRIVQIIGNGSLKKRLAEMGITSGQQITVVKAAPLDDPIQVKVRNYDLSLRRDEACNVIIEKE